MNRVCMCVFSVRVRGGDESLVGGGDAMMGEDMYTRAAAFAFDRLGSVKLDFRTRN